MGSFRDQMQQLAEEITRTRRERKSCVAHLAKEREQLRASVSKQREKTQRELAKQAHELARELSSFNRHNKKTVSQSLRETRIERTGQARALKSTLRQETALNRRNIARVLRQHGSERQRMQRQQERAAIITRQTIQQHVRRIRTTTNRMTTAWAADRSEAKRIWERLHASASSSRHLPVDKPIPAKPAVEAAALTAVAAPTQASGAPLTSTAMVATNTLSATGLALPPTR